MKKATEVSNHAALAALLGINEVPLTVILGKPPKDAKSVTMKAFAKRIQHKAKTQRA